MVRSLTRATLVTGGEIAGPLPDGTGGDPAGGEVATMMAWFGPADGLGEPQAAAKQVTISVAEMVRMDRTEVLRRCAGGIREIMVRHGSRNRGVPAWFSPCCCCWAPQSVHHAGRDGEPFAQGVPVRCAILCT